MSSEPSTHSTNQESSTQGSKPANASSPRSFATSKQTTSTLQNEILTPTQVPPNPPQLHLNHYNNQQGNSPNAFFERFHQQQQPRALEKNAQNSQHNQLLSEEKFQFSKFGSSSEAQEKAPPDSVKAIDTLSSSSFIETPLQEYHHPLSAPTSSSSNNNSSTRVKSPNLENFTNQEVFSKRSHLAQYHHAKIQKVPSEEPLILDSTLFLQSRLTDTTKSGAKSLKDFSRTSKRFSHSLGKTKFDSYFDFRPFSRHSRKKGHHEQSHKNRLNQRSSSETQNLVEFSNSEKVSSAQPEELESTNQNNNENMANALTPPKKASKFRVFLATACFSGLQFGWALQIALLTPFILELGLSKTLITLVWLCGPVTGLIVQPIVGVLSDKCKSPLGKRRPFLIVGTIMVALSLLLIPNSLDLGHWMGDTTTDHTVAIVLAIIGFWILDVSNNTLQGPTRALVADMASHKNQAFGNATLTFWSGLGNILGYLAGFVKWSSYITAFKTEACSEGCQNLKICFLISIGFLLLTFVVTLFAAREESTWKKKSSATINSAKNSAEDVNMTMEGGVLDYSTSLRDHEEEEETKIDFLETDHLLMKQDRSINSVSGDGEEKPASSSIVTRQVLSSMSSGQTNFRKSQSEPIQLGVTSSPTTNLMENSRELSNRQGNEYYQSSSLKRHFNDEIDQEEMNPSQQEPQSFSQEGSNSQSPQTILVDATPILEHNLIKEKQEHTIFPPDARNVSLSGMKSARQLAQYLRAALHLPKAMWRVCLVNFFSWFGWFCFLVYITTWVGENVFHGNSDESSPAYALYVKGVQYGSFGLAGFAGSSIIFSLILPSLTHKLGFKWTFFIGQLSLALCLGSTLFVTNKILALLVITAFGFPWAVNGTIPFAIVATIAKKHEKGTYMGLLNIFIVVPQLVMSSVGPLISYISHGNVAWTLMVGAISVLVSSGLIYFLIIPKKIERRRKKGGMGFGGGGGGH
ncbi:hypothetical protein C9374_011127 [Naegleria lovaniensis]|uniref:Sucrose transporter n=1 Tax=Naegleria lovaniensis TaxID=51637 RepID=A0AA88GF52_NAELO|nr:uncharacterized protein C9374_011127 [Naegleria lovaniensis]KAG2374048.1 hypothetical protein C9374_011127 [Naegleria lovaniensis]